MQNVGVDLSVAQAMAAELSDYLLGDRLFRQMVVQTPAGTQQPKMTLGGLLSRYQRLSHLAGRLSADEQKSLDDLKSKIEEARRIYHAQWEQFLRRELKSYLDSWRWFIDECGRRGGCASGYPGEVHARLRLALLIDEARTDGLDVLAEQGQLRGLDGRLRSLWQDGAFLLDDELRALYPQEACWWLYGLPRGSDR